MAVHFPGCILTPQKDPLLRSFINSPLLSPLPVPRQMPVSTIAARIAIAMMPTTRMLLSLT